MNLNEQPTIDQLASLLAKQKDSHGNHIVWICRAGTVHIDCLPPGANEEEFIKRTPNLSARLKTYHRGLGYVGRKAAADTDFVGKVLQNLQHAWARQQANG